MTCGTAGMLKWSVHSWDWLTAVRTLVSGRAAVSPATDNIYSPANSIDSELKPEVLLNTLITAIGHQPAAVDLAYRLDH